MKETFELTIINQKRILLSLLLFLMSILVSILIGIKFNIIIGIFSFIFISLMLTYFVFGNLTITIQDEIIQFTWQKKLLFNFREIQSLKQSEIEKVIVDNGLFLRKIITKNRTINISTSTIKPKDASKLISYFNHREKTTKCIIKNSWENISKKSLKTCYILNWSIIIASSIALILVIITKGFNVKMLFVLAIIPTLVGYGQTIKKAIEKKDSNSH